MSELNGLKKEFIDMMTKALEENKDYTWEFGSSIPVRFLNVNENNWIKCSIEKPNLRENLLFVNGKGEVTFGRCFDIDIEGVVWIEDDDRITNEIAKYWMALPEPPKD